MLRAYAEHPHQRIQRHTKIAEILLWPHRRILVDADDAVDQQRRSPTRRETVIAIALVEGVGGGIEPPAEAFDERGVRFAIAIRKAPPLVGLRCRWRGPCL